MFSEQVLMKGHFEIKDEVDGSFHLPSIPGYDLDINENVQLSPKDRYGRFIDNHVVKVFVVGLLNYKSLKRLLCPNDKYN